MKVLHPLSLAGAALAAAGTALTFTQFPWLGPLAGMLGLLLADKGGRKNGSVPKAWLIVLSGLLLAAASGLAFHPLLGLGLGLVVLGLAGRLPFVSRGTLAFWWLDPLLAYPGLALAAWGAWLSPHWLAWIPAAFALYLGVAVSMGLVMSFKMLALARRGYAVEPGKPAPGFSLNDESGQSVDLASFRGRSHVLLIFVRGDWCPSCHITLRTYARNKERFQEQGVMLLAIGPDPVGVNLRMVKEMNVPYRMLSDEGQRTAMAYGVQLGDDFSKNMYKEGVPLPASFLVDKDGVVRYTSRPERAGEFLDPATIFPALQKLAA